LPVDWNVSGSWHGEILDAEDDNIRIADGQNITKFLTLLASRVRIAPEGQEGSAGKPSNELFG
jgi:hypothetical protein